MPADPHRVLFVCLGNICRSPTAEAVFRVAAAKAGLSHVEADSAGTGDWHVGSPPDGRAIRHAARRGYDLRTLRARQFTRDDFARFDRIYAMDTPVLANWLVEKRPDLAARLVIVSDDPELFRRHRRLLDLMPEVLVKPTPAASLVRAIEAVGNR